MSDRVTKGLSNNDRLRLGVEMDLLFDLFWWMLVIDAFSALCPPPFIRVCTSWALISTIHRRASRNHLLQHTELANSLFALRIKHGHGEFRWTHVFRSAVPRWGVSGKVGESACAVGRQQVEIFPHRAHAGRGLEPVKMVVRACYGRAY